MAKYVEPGKSLECHKSDVATRKVSKTPILVAIEGITYFKYSTKIRCIIKIVEELNPKVFRICETSALSADDELEGDGIDIYTEKRIKKLNLTSNFSHVHGIQSNIINSYTYAKILIPFRFVLERRALVS